MLQFSTVLHLCAESELAARGDNTSGWDAPKRVAGLEVSERSTGRTISCQALIADYEGGAISFPCLVNKETGSGAFAQPTAKRCCATVPERTRSHEEIGPMW